LKQIIIFSICYLNAEEKQEATNMDALQKKAGDLLEQMKKDRDYIYPEWEFAARHDPDFLEAYNNLYKVSLNDGQALPAKTRELIAICLLAYRGEVDSTVAHMKRALRLGATRQEILEALESSIIPGGAPTFYHGLTAMLIVFEQSESK
jgi:alkylhydroperoxidase/carboxymuconolactone decarboxylase family protein YurZ